ncbi:FadR family transcriptional regulator (plasmid) [Skermanella rosea]|uniref:FadR family transcriptional regulator n=1 Tax=Skermanella cutis TaxID=2775420 RepID=A0ABX7BEG2_9PROT|nr:MULTISPECIES: FadR/GntR family transcriptional regulator [Skermanella]QQP92799.1 FadR family transcriptional regulator [Skermanella sp. TT6]UEM07646.1 FadR family transcriptional regulator [Skermanella rosea]
MTPLNGARAPVPQTIVWRIQDMIQSGEIKPGEKLPSQRDLAVRFSISRASLREAMSVLETLGSIRIEPGRGAVVCAEGSQPGWRFGNRIPKEDVFQVRLHVEAYTAGLAAPRITQSEVDELRRTIGEMRTCFEEGQLEGVARTDLHFHTAIVTAAGNRVFTDMYQSFSAMILESHRAPLTARDRLYEPVAEHESIVAALERHDAEGAVYHMRYHLIRAAGRSGIDEDLCRSW